MDFIISDEQSQPAVMERDIVPAGVHHMVIKHAEEGPNEYKRSDENPNGMCLKLRLATTDGNYKFVFDDIPQHLGWRAKQLADAAGVLASGAKVSLQPDTLVGLELAVEVSHYTSKAGKLSAVVKRYVASQQQAAKPAVKPKSAKVAATTTDDIPF